MLISTMISKKFNQLTKLIEFDDVHHFEDNENMTLQ